MAENQWGQATPDDDYEGEDEQELTVDGFFNYLAYLGTPEEVLGLTPEEIKAMSEPKTCTCGRPWVDGKCAGGFINHKVK